MANRERPNRDNRNQPQDPQNQDRPNRVQPNQNHNLNVVDAAVGMRAFGAFLSQLHDTMQLLIRDATRMLVDLDRIAISEARTEALVRSMFEDIRQLVRMGLSLTVILNTFFSCSVDIAAMKKAVRKQDYRPLRQSINFLKHIMASVRNQCQLFDEAHQAAQQSLVRAVEQCRYKKRQARVKKAAAILVAGACVTVSVAAGIVTGGAATAVGVSVTAAVVSGAVVTITTGASAAVCIVPVIYSFHEAEKDFQHLGNKLGLLGRTVSGVNHEVKKVHFGLENVSFFVDLIEENSAYQRSLNASSYIGMVSLWFSQWWFWLAGDESANELAQAAEMFFSDLNSFQSDSVSCRMRLEHLEQELTDRVNLIHSVS